MGYIAVQALVDLLGTSWFPIMALNDIVAEDVHNLPEDAGRFDVLTENWRRWAKLNQYDV